MKFEGYTNTYDVSTIGMHPIIGNLNSWFVRGDSRYRFYTSIINERFKPYLERNYGFDKNRGGLLINMQMRAFRHPSKHEGKKVSNDKPTRYGFLQETDNENLRLVLFPEITKEIDRLTRLPAGTLERAIVQQLTTRIDNEAKRKGIFTPVQLHLPL